MNLATILTASRLFFAPLFAISFLKSSSNGFSSGWLWLSLLWMALIELSDAFDGVVARGRNEVTDFGKIFDPVCDSLSRLTIFISFLLTGIIPLWMFLLFMYRDSLMSFFRIMCAVDGTVIAARLSGKLKAIFQAIGSFTVVGLLLMNSYGIINLPQKVWNYHPGFWVMVFPAFFTFISVFDYLIPNISVIKRRMIPVNK